MTEWPSHPVAADDRTDNGQVNLYEDLKMATYDNNKNNNVIIKIIKKIIKTTTSNEVL